MSTLSYSTKGQMNKPHLKLLVREVLGRQGGPEPGTNHVEPRHLGHPVVSVALHQRASPQT
jgi:hypothetical protein